MMVTSCLPGDTISDRTSNNKILTIVSPIGETGCWIIESIGSSIENGINYLSKMINNDSTGFEIYISDCANVVPENIKLSDNKLRYLDIPNAVIYIDGKIMKKNKEIFSCMVKESITNPAYKEWFTDRCSYLGETYTSLVTDFCTAIQALS